METVKTILARFIMIIFLVTVLLPTLPLFLVVLGFGKLCNFTDVGFWEFTKAWLTFQVIP